MAYLRVSTDEQASSGLGLEAQRAKLQSECAHRGWNDVQWIEDAGVSAKSLARPGLARASSFLSAAKRVCWCDEARPSLAECDRPRRVAGEANREDRSLVILDLGLDLTTPNGKFVAGIMAQVAELERELIAERTRNALAITKANGARLGSPDHLRIPSEVRELIVRERSGGSTLQAIADQLNARRVLTARGGARWWPSTVANVV